MKRDIDRLKQEANVFDVLNYLGVEVTKRGSNYFLLCPSPDHHDHKATNCHFSDGWSGVYCEACKQYIGAVDIIMYNTGAPFLEACDLLWEISGRPDWYFENGNANYGSNYYRLSREDAELIGIKMPCTILLPIQEDKQKVSLPKGYRYDKSYMGKDGNSYLRCKTETARWWDMISAVEFAKLTEQKAKERKEQLLIIKQECTAFPVYTQEMLSAFDDLIRSCDRIIKEAERCQLSAMIAA